VASCDLMIYIVTIVAVPTGGWRILSIFYVNHKNIKLLNDTLFLLTTLNNTSVSFIVWGAVQHFSGMEIYKDHYGAFQL